MGHPEVTIHPYIRHVDGCPSKPSQLELGEVQGGNVVGVMLKSAFNTSEERLGSPVGFISMSASWTGLRSVPWIDINYWDSSLKSFVFDKGLKFSERPAMEISILTFHVFSSIPDSSQFLHYDYVAFFKGVHELPADLMQNSINPSSLLSTQPFQSAFSRLRAFGLKRRTKLSKTPSLPENSFPFNLEAVGGNKKVIHTDVNTNRVIPFRLWSRLVNCNMEKEGFVSINQDCVGRLSIFKKFSLILSDVKRWLHSLLNRRDRRIDAIRFVDKPEKSLIQIYRKLIKLKEFISFLLVGFSYSVPCSYGEICWKIKSSPRLSVNHVVKSNRVEHSPFKGYLRNIVASITKSLCCAKQLFKVFSGWLKFADHGLRELHFKKAYMLFQYLKVLQFLPRLKPWVSLEGF